MGSGGTVCSAHQTEMGGVSKGLQTAKCSAHTELPGPGGSVGGRAGLRVGEGWGRDCLVAFSRYGAWWPILMVKEEVWGPGACPRPWLPAACRPPWAGGMGSLGLGGNRNPDLSLLPGESHVWWVRDPFSSMRVSGRAPSSDAPGEAGLWTLGMRERPGATGWLEAKPPSL